MISLPSDRGQKQGKETSTLWGQGESPAGQRSNTQGLGRGFTRRRPEPCPRHGTALRALHPSNLGVTQSLPSKQKLFWGVPEGLRDKSCLPACLAAWNPTGQVQCPAQPEHCLSSSVGWAGALGLPRSPGQRGSCATLRKKRDWPESVHSAPTATLGAPQPLMFSPGPLLISTHSPILPAPRLPLLPAVQSRVLSLPHPQSRHTPEPLCPDLRGQH